MGVLVRSRVEKSVAPFAPPRMLSFTSRFRRVTASSIIDWEDPREARLLMWERDEAWVSCA